ncbi:Zn-dependent hydrolase [Acidisphaera sp. L21]|uniref:Zn-dependent hydrolase n=1 Tax=Acidisphaera sp. L21 TaxID=1641851 RepID=UPI00131BCD4B|nr:Zn-dependent hydrolase [Acidisphaera sp. L21]
MATIDTARFLADLNDLRKIGAYKTGVHRPTFSPQDMESRRWLMARMAEIGLEPVLDGIGNVYGRNTGPGPYMLVGSHIESQNYAGWLDGALGVVAGLALARAGLPVDVCAFADEEGHFEGGFLGSRSFIGDLSDDEMDHARSRNDGSPLRDALKAAGLEGVPRITVEKGRHKGYLELHIEQGTSLEGAGQQTGIVTGIVAIWQFRLTIIGQQDHAGGTTMAERKDAGLTAVRLLAAIDETFPLVCGDRTVWTTGSIVLEPGAPSIIPGKAEILFQFRDVDWSTLERLEKHLRALVQESNRRERCTTELSIIRRSIPAICDPAIMTALERSAEQRIPGGWRAMPSGAGHDAQVLAQVMPSAMLFSPSIGGISHHWAEDTKEEDLAVCCEVMGDAVEMFLKSNDYTPPAKA